MQVEYGYGYISEKDNSYVKLTRVSTHLPEELCVIQKALRGLHGVTRRPIRSQVLNDLHCQALHVTALLKGYGQSLAALK